MPTYEYECVKCGKTFQRQEHLNEHESAHPRCPECGAEKVHQVFSPFFAKTSKKS